MTRRRLRSFVIPTVYIVSISAIVLSVILIGRTIKSVFTTQMDKYYVINALIDSTLPVTKTTSNTSIIKPFNSEKVTINKTFYSKDYDEAKQKQGLIYFENTYMQNSGTLYSSEEAFDILSVLDGTVKYIKEDNMLGVVVIIEHNDNLSTMYYSINDLKINVGDAIKQGDIIGLSSINKLDTSKDNNLLFEVNYNGEFIDPEKFYEMKIEDLYQ